MNGKSDENLRELFGKFLDAEEADRAVEDVQKAEQILSEYPAPEPHKKLIADIKSEITTSLLRRQVYVFRRIVYKTAVVAAAVILLAVISVRLLERGGGEPERFISGSKMAKVIWESDDVSADDADLAILTAEIEQIEGEVLALQLGEAGGNGHEAVAELEMELIEINSDFWKG